MDENVGETSRIGNTKEKILMLLLNSPKTSGEIAKELKIQKSAVRSHLESLKLEKAVTTYFEAPRLGRPRKVYELTQIGRERFVRMYDEILLLVLKKISQTRGKDQLRKIVESVADEIGENIMYEMQKKDEAYTLEEKLKILNSVSNEMGFMSSLNREKDGSYSLTSKNCIVHKIALNNQDIICHGLHDRLIMKSMDGKKSNIGIELRDCIALGNNICKHIITKR